MAFLRDGAIAKVEAGLALLADIDVPRVRQLLYGMDKRGLAALCARAGFGAPHYIAIRMALDLAEQGMEGADPGCVKTRQMIGFLDDCGGIGWGVLSKVQIAVRRRCFPSAWTTGSTRTTPSA